MVFNRVAAQEIHRPEPYETEPKNGGFCLAAIIGHTYIKSEGTDKHLFIPSWGLDIDYWFGHRWGVGLHNDVEIENFVVVRNDIEEIERINPVVFTLDALYHISNGIVISIGPGIEVERNESYFLARMGIEYESEIGNGFYVMPTVFFDKRFDGFSTATVGLGLGHHF